MRHTHLPRHTRLLSSAAVWLLPKVARLLPAAGRLLRPANALRHATACALVVVASAHACAQTRAGEASGAAPPRPTQAGTQTTRAATTADEDFELNIDQRRISEKQFHAETAVETDGTRGLLLGVGVALRASDIDVLLLGVRGRVRFRANLAPVLRLLDARRGPSPPAQTPP